MTAALIKRVHVARRDAGLDEDTYRDLLDRETGKRSLRLMTGPELGRVIDALGGQPGAGTRKPLRGPYAKKLQALWIAGWNLGVVRNPDDAAMLAFIERQTGIQNTTFLRAHADAVRAIEAIKKWLARDSGIDWSEDYSEKADWANRFGLRIAKAQCALLTKRGVAFPHLPDWLRQNGYPPPYALQEHDWHDPMNELGRLIRSGQGG